MAEPNRRLQVFLCHASADKTTVQELYERLQKSGVDTWLDTAKLIPGQNWQLQIPAAVRSSDIVLICLSNNSINKEGYVQKEITYALDKAMELPEDRIYLIPVRLEKCVVPARLSPYQWVDLYSEDGYERLLLALTIRAGQIGAEPPIHKTAVVRRRSRPQPGSKEKSGDTPVEQPAKPRPAIRKRSVSSLAGLNLQGYRLLEKTGESDLLVSYKAHGTAQAKDVTLKILRPELQMSVELFTPTLEDFSKLRHAGLASIAGYGQYQGVPYFVVEEFTPETVKEMLGRPIFWRTVLELLLPVGRALEYLHGQGILHLELKPESILIAEDGTSKLDDFASNSLRQLAASDRLGIRDPRYMSPEQAAGGPVDVRSDVYSLGVILYEMLTGHSPHSGGPHQIPEVPPPVMQTVWAALARGPEERFPNMTSLVQALEKCLAPERPEQVPGLMPDRYSSPAKQQSRSQGSGAAMLLGIILILAILGSVVGLVSSVLEKISTASRSQTATAGVVTQTAISAANTTEASIDAADMDLVLHNVEVSMDKTGKAHSVEAFVSVLDSDGNPVRDLSTGNFSIAEDGVSQPITEFRMADDPLSLGLILDTSGSMETDFENAKGIAINLVNTLQSKDGVELVSFNSNIRSELGLTTNLEMVKSRIQSLEAVPDSGSCLYDALYSSIQSLGEAVSGTPTIVVITDGVDVSGASRPCSSRTVEDVVDLATQGRRRVPIFAIGLGQTGNLSVLDQITNRTGGTFLSIADPLKLASALPTFADGFRSQYVLRYVSKGLPGRHSLTVSANVQQNQSSTAGEIILPPLPAGETPPSLLSSVIVWAAIIVSAIIILGILSLLFGIVRGLVSRRDRAS